MDQHHGYRSRYEKVSRQVRKMTAKIGLPTLRLVRHRVGPYTLEGLSVGDSEIIVE